MKDTERIDWYIQQCEDKVEYVRAWYRFAKSVESTSRLMLITLLISIAISIIGFIYLWATKGI